jgi:type VI secretion system protein ImpC
MPERLEFDVTFGRDGRRRGETEPLRLLLLGDFSGQPIRQRPPLATRPTLQVDIDTEDAVMKRLGPRADTAAGDLHFAQLDDFHPDRLAVRIEPIRALLEKRRQPPADHHELFGRLLGKNREDASPPTPLRSGLDALLHDIVAPYVVKDQSAETRPYRAAIDTALAEQMRAVLHDKTLQSVEAAWRGVHWLTSHVDLDEHLQLHLFDVARDELVADIVAAGGKSAETGLYHALVDRWRNVPGGLGWSALVVLLEFGGSDADVGLLAALGLVASQAGGPLLAGAEISVMTGDETKLAAWNRLRRSEAAPWIALAAPRVLLRAPYGKRGDPIDGFPFEEFDGPPRHEALLWGNGGLALALLVARAFAARGWEMEVGDERELDDLPVYVFDRDGEPEMQPCTEHLLTESQLERLLNAGIVPLAGRRDRNTAVAIRFQSIAHPPVPLAW